MSRKILKGVVVGDKADKTISVLVERKVLFPLYRKYVRRHKKYSAHDPNNSFKVGDDVFIIETAPISKTKRWRVLSDLEKSSIKSMKILRSNARDSSLGLENGDSNKEFLGESLVNSEVEK